MTDTTDVLRLSMDQTSLGRPASLRRNRTLQATPQLASLLCEMRAQRPDLLAVSWDVGTLILPIYTMVGRHEVVAGEYGDKMLVRRVGKTIEVYSPFLGWEVSATRREVKLATEPRETTAPAVPRKATRRRVQKRVQKVVST